jgi:hypothetical protein
MEERIMDLMSTAQLLGNFGEFAGALAVVATLFYLALQVRHSREATEANTRAMEESRRLTLAQTYASRATSLFQANVDSANGPVGELIAKVLRDGAGALSPDEQGRLGHYCWGQRTFFDSIHYQYQQGFVDSEYYESQFKSGVRIWSPIWRDIGLDHANLRPDFARELEQIVNEAHRTGG